MRNMYLCIQERTDPNGAPHTITMILPGATAEDAANYMLSMTHLLDDWRVRNVRVAPLDTVLEWEVTESAAWKLGRPI